MDLDGLKQFVQEIVKKANNLKDAHTYENGAPVNYACIFCQDKEQFGELMRLSERIGKVIEEGPTGTLFHIEPIGTIAGKLQLLKIRKPDSEKPELGDADFTVSDYPEFKKKYLAKEGFKLIYSNYNNIKKFEMIELTDSKYNIRTYFSNPPLTKQLGIS